MERTKLWVTSRRHRNVAQASEDMDFLALWVLVYSENNIGAERSIVLWFSTGGDFVLQETSDSCLGTFWAVTVGGVGATGTL